MAEPHYTNPMSPDANSRPFGAVNLAFGWVSITIAVYVLYNFSFFAVGGPFNVPAWENFVFIFLIFGPALVLHEAMHIFAARKFGFPAGFKIWPLGVMIMLMVSLAGALFAVPGATIIGSDENHQPSEAQLCVIAIAGPVMNILFGLFSASIVGIGLLMRIPIVTEVGLYSAGINTFLAGFNLLPVSILDGAKVYRSDKKLWARFFFPSIIIGIIILFGIL